MITIPLVDPAELFLEIQPETKQESWQLSQAFESARQRWNIYLNALCSNVVLLWLHTLGTPQAKYTESSTERLSQWLFVNGSRVTDGHKQFVLLPTEAITADELEVPQEWVDLPSWVGDYYCLVQVNPDEHWLKFVGYISHANLKVKGTYDANSRHYYIDIDDLTSDFTILQVTAELYPEDVTRTAVSPLPTLELTRAQNLLQRCNVAEFSFARLSLPFDVWGALIERPQWRQQLAQKLTGRTTGRAQGAAVNLRQWVQDTQAAIAAGWCDLAELLTSSLIHPTVEAQLQGLRELEPDDTLPLRHHAKLVQLADSEATVVCLMLSLKPTSDERFQVKIRVYPVSQSEQPLAYLPERLSLQLLEAGEILTSVRATSRDRCILLRQFTCEPGDTFGLQLELAQITHTEQFVT
ncbi:MAG: DUF1822 family protein [Cyanobacteria bacterium P01_H01_bin.121]